MQQIVEDPLHVAKGLFSDLLRVTRLSASAYWTALTKLGHLPVLPPVETWPWRVLAAPGIMTVVHYILYAIIRWTGLARHRTTADRLIWFSVSTGSAIAWTYMLYPIVGAATVGNFDEIPGFDSHLVHALVSSYMLSWVVMCLYYWATGMTSTDVVTSPGFYVRKFLPAAAAIAFPFALAPALAPIHSGSPLLADRIFLVGRQSLTAWLLQYSLLDAAIDLAHLLHSTTLKAVLIIPWYLVFSGIWLVMGSHVPHPALGLVPLSLVVGLGCYVLYFDLIPSLVRQQQQQQQYPWPQQEAGPRQ